MASDLTSFLSKTQSNIVEKGRYDLVVTQDNILECSITELYTTEGFSSIEIIPSLGEDNIHRYSSMNVVNAVLDFRGVSESDLLVKAMQMVTLLDTDISLIVLGDIDSISLQNQIYHLGAVYVLWDANLHNLNLILASRLNGLAPIGKSIRNAKRVLVVGTKGGVGVSSFSSMLAHALACKAHLKVMLVEHDMYCLTSDTYLGLKQFKIKQNPGNLTILDIDAVVAESYVHKIQDKLDYVALDSRLVSLQEHTDLLYRLSEELSGNYNFVIDSVPISSLGVLNLRENLDRFHRVYLICEPSVASLRAFNKIIRILGNTKVQTVFNLARPEKDYVMTINSAKERIKIQSSINLRYEAGLEKHLLQQGITSVSKCKYFSPFVQIIKDLTGKNIQPKAKFSLFRK